MTLLAEGLPQGVSGAILVILSVSVGALFQWVARRHTEKREVSDDVREDEAGVIALARFHREEGEKLLVVVAELRKEMQAQKLLMQAQIDALKSVNQSQAQEIYELRGKVSELQRDRTRQTNEGVRQTEEGVRQTHEGERQTIEGERLRSERRDIESERG